MVRLVAERVRPDRAQVVLALASIVSTRRRSVA
jgi:hypothetical protein